MTRDYIVSNNVSSTAFLFIAFSITAMVSIFQQKTWKYLSYVNARRIPILVFQAILLSFSFLCLIHGIATNGVLQYYAIINIMQILNMFSNVGQLKSSQNRKYVPRLQLLSSLLCFAIGLYLLCSNQSVIGWIGVISLMLYHFSNYLRQQHYDSAKRQHKSLGRIEPLGLLLAAFLVLSISVFSHLNLALPKHGHVFDVEGGEYINDERFSLHSANHDLDGESVKFTHRRLMGVDNDIEYERKMKELEELAEGKKNGDKASRSKNKSLKSRNLKKNAKKQLEYDNDPPLNAPSLPPPSVWSKTGYLLWSTVIYTFFVLFFIILSPHLSSLQLRLYELVFVNPKLDAAVKHIKSKERDSLDSTSKPMADILKLTKSPNSTMNGLSSSGHTVSSSKMVQVAPRWSKVLCLYQLVSMQWIGIVSYLIVSIFRSNEHTLSTILGALVIFLGNECAIRCSMTLSLSYHPPWFNRLLYFLFGSMVVNAPLSMHSHSKHHRHHHGHHHHGDGKWSHFPIGYLMSCLVHIPSFTVHLKETRTSRRIFIFLSINFLFMFVEFVYGYWSNSLGLISDACHMLFDCIALCVGLLASYLGSHHAVISTANDTKNKYSYGYGKIKVMSGFVNAIFLIYIGISVLIESFERILHPPHIHTDQLLVVSVLGLLVNLIGLFFFHDAHMMGHEAHGTTCSHGHHHHHDHHGHDHHHGHNHDHNIRGIFLHILADTLGSIGVIVSSLLIHYFDLTISDALCSVFIAILIFVTVYPLIESTSKVLLQETPPHVMTALRNELSTVLGSVNGVIGYREAHFWECEPGRLVGTIHVQIEEDADQQQVLQQLISILKSRFGFRDEKDITVQLEKQSYLDRCDPIHHSVYSNIVQIQQRKSRTKKVRESDHHNHNQSHGHSRNGQRSSLPPKHGHDHSHGHDDHDHSHDDHGHDHHQDHGHNHSHGKDQHGDHHGHDHHHDHHRDHHHDHNHGSGCNHDHSNEEKHKDHHAHSHHDHHSYDGRFSEDSSFINI